MRAHSTVSLIVALASTVSTQVNPERELKLASYRYLTSFDLLPLFSTAELPARGGYRFEIRAILDGGTAPKIETAVLAECALVP